MPVQSASRDKRARRYLRGVRAELLACGLLRLKGYAILARRLRTPLGEIDILACRGDTVVLVEVKQRPDLATAAGAIAPRQQERLAHAARFVLAQRPELRKHTFRFDAVLVNRWGWVRHMVNAWGDEGTG